MKKIVITIILMTILMLPSSVYAKVKIADVEYETLDEAVEKAKKGDTITLLDDVDVTDTIKYNKAYYNWLLPDNSILDLNGHTIITGQILIENKYLPNSVWLGNNITIKNGKFISQFKGANGEDLEANYALFLGDEVETSNITLENIEVSTGINIYNTLNATLKNVTATGRTYYAVWLDEYATATIESGNFNTKGFAVVGIAQAKDEDGNVTFDSELTIKGGTFKAEKGKLSLSESDDKYLPPIIKGGTYDFDVTEFVAEDYECTKKNDKFVVGLKEYDRDIIFDGNINDLPLKVDMDELTKILLDTINNSEIDIDKKDIKITLEINETKPTDETTQKMLDKIKNGTIANYFDVVINVIDKDTNKVIGNITELNNRISLSILIPDELKASEGYFRKYYILREHNGIIDIIEPTLSKDKTTLIFETDKFSTYALAYEDINNTEIDNPNTKDNLKENIILMSVFSSIAIIGIGYLVKNEKITKSF